jgi:biotin synthase
MEPRDIIKKSRDGEPLTKSEIVRLLECPADSPETYAVMADANRLSKELTGNRAEVHGQLALNLGPCPCNCMFCSFAQANGVFEEEIRLDADSIVASAQQLEREGVNAIYVMVTARYPLGLFIEMSHEIRRHLKPSTVMIANVGDQSLSDALKIKDAGYAGVYHALRLREGEDTGLVPDKRRASIRNFLEVGLQVGTCVEPVGPEHTSDELAEMILFTASFAPAFSGAARRISIPGTRMAERGMISELRMAQIVAVTRLSMPRTVRGNCTHEPCTLGGLAGANLFWAEVGANPRDTEAKTEEGRGDAVSDCRQMFYECGWKVLEAPSRYFGNIESVNSQVPVRGGYSTQSIMSNSP